MRCFQEVEQYERHRGYKYDWILCVRTDNSYTFRLPRREKIPTPNQTQKLVCTTFLGVCTDPLGTGVGMEDQWALVSRAAAPFFFEALHLLHEHCIYRRVLERRPPRHDGIRTEEEAHKHYHDGQCPAPVWPGNDQGALGPGLVTPCTVIKSQARTAVAPLLFDANLCQIPVLPPNSERYIQRKFWPLIKPSFPEATIADFHALDLNAARAVYDLTPQIENNTPNIHTFAPRTDHQGHHAVRKDVDRNPSNYVAGRMTPRKNETTLHARSDCIRTMVKELWQVGFHHFDRHTW